MTIYNMLKTNIKQRDRDWHIAKQLAISPSQFHLLVNASSEVKNKILSKVIDNKFKIYKDDFDISSFRSEATDHGNKFEKIALHCFLDEYKLYDKFKDNNINIDSCIDLFYVDLNLPVCCSPDFYCDRFSLGIEIKCPFTNEVHEQHLKGIISDQYFYQILGYILFLDIRSFYFVSFKPDHENSLAIIKITYNKVTFDILKKALNEFFYRYCYNAPYENKKEGIKKVLLSGNLDTLFKRNKII